MPAALLVLFCSLQAARRSSSDNGAWRHYGSIERGESVRVEGSNEATLSKLRCQITNVESLVLVQRYSRAQALTRG